MPDISQPEPADQDVLRRIAAGDPAALDQLYQRHGLALLRYLTGLLGDRQQAEDVLQEVMLAVWKSAGQFRGDSRVSTWLLSIARNRALTSRRRHPEYQPLEDADRLADDSPALDDLLQTDSHQAELQAALRRLPAGQRETLELLFYHALTGTETATILGVSPGTVKSRLHRALATLRGLLHGETLHER